MASPFENLLQASQFAVQTRLAYDQMAQRGRENTQALLQRRAEQAQQGEQFLSEMNVKDRQLKMASDQFDVSMKLEQEKFKRQDYIATEQLGIAKEQLGMAKDEQAYQQSVGMFSDPWYRLQYYIYRTRPNEGRPPEPPTQIFTVTSSENDLAAGYKNLPSMFEAIMDPTKVGLKVSSTMMGSGNYPYQAMQVPFKLAEMNKTEADKTADNVLIELKKVQMAAQQAAVTKGGQLDPISTSFAITKAVAAYEQTKESMSEDKRKEVEAYLSTMQQLGLIPKNEEPKK